MARSAADDNGGTHAAPVEIGAADAARAEAIADIHLRASRAAMPYLRRPHSDDATRAWFAGTLRDDPSGWWVAVSGDRVVGYMQLTGDSVEHLYVSPDWQGRGVGSALLAKSKTLSPGALLLWTFQRNTVSTKQGQAALRNPLLAP